MSKRDYYDVLGVNRNAGEDEIKKVYRKLAMEHHPDRNPDNPKSEERFKEAKEAYEILSDPNKRAAYDQHGHAGVDPSMAEVVVLRASQIHLVIFLVIFLEDKETDLTSIVVQTYAITWKLHWNRRPVGLKRKYGFLLWNPVKLVMGAERNKALLLLPALPVMVMAR